MISIHHHYQKTDDDRKLDEKIHVEDKHKQNADSSETVDIKVSQVHLIVALKKKYCY